jgi:hypothetical protein
LVVLGSEVGALGRYERVPLGEESDSYKRTPFVSNLRIPCSMELRNGGIVYVPHMSQQLQAERMSVERQTLRSEVSRWSACLESSADAAGESQIVIL